MATSLSLAGPRRTGTPSACDMQLLSKKFVLWITLLLLGISRNRNVYVPLVADDQLPDLLTIGHIWLLQWTPSTNSDSGGRLLKGQSFETSASSLQDRPNQVPAKGKKRQPHSGPIRVRQNRSTWLIGGKTILYGNIHIPRTAHLCHRPIRNLQPMKSLAPHKSSIIALANSSVHAGQSTAVPSQVFSACYRQLGILIGGFVTSLSRSGPCFAPITQAACLAKQFAPLSKCQDFGISGIVCVSSRLPSGRMSGPSRSTSAGMIRDIKSR